MTWSQIARMAWCTALVTLLAGCGNDDAGDVRRWMDETRSQAPVKITEISPPKRFTPFTYGGKGGAEPYSPSKIAHALPPLSMMASGRKPDLDRPREALEAFPLDAMKMVGTMQKHGTLFAVVQAGTGVFKVRLGNHIGQNLGQVTKITDATVELTEIAQDASGEWIERPAKLDLQEKKP